MQQKLCGLDIDGVLNEYPKCWVDFVNLMTGSQFVNLNEMKNTLTYTQYKNLKHLYRSSGYKEDLPVRFGAINLTRTLKRAGFGNILVTSRPFDKYPDLRMQTKRWLEKGQLVYDDLLYSGKKHLEIITQYPDIKFMVEDNRAFANDIARCGYRVYLLSNEYNRGDVHENIVRINSLEEIIVEEDLI